MSKSLQPEDLCEKWKGGIVCIKANDRLEGGGVFVQVGPRQLVLTAAHVVYKKKKLRVHCSDERSFQVKIDHISRKEDLAWLEVVKGDMSGLQCLKLADTGISKDSRVHFIGHPRMARYSYAIGQVVCTSRTCHNIYFDELQLPEKPKFDEHPEFLDDFLGLSSKIALVQAKNIHGGGRIGGTGAPFLDSNGDIVGIYSFAYQECDYAIHSRIIKQVQDIAEARYEQREIGTAQASTSGM